MRTYLNLKLLTKILLFLSFFYIGTVSATCQLTNGALNTSNGAGNPVNDLGDGGISNQCDYVPDEYQMNIFRMSLCTSNPDIAGREPNFSSCSDMISETGSSTIATITGNNETFLNIPDFTIPENTYGFMIARLSARIGVKHATQVTTAVNSWNSVGALNGVGTFCWTENNALTNVSNEVVVTPFGSTVVLGPTNISNIRCSNNAANLSNAAFSFEVVNVSANAGCIAFGADGDRADMGPVGNGNATSRFMRNATSSATACTNVNSILWVITLANPIEATASTNYVLNFRTTDSVSIDFNGAPGDGAGNPLGIKVGANAIQVFLSTTE